MALWNACPHFRHECSLKMWFTGTRWQFLLRAVQEKEKKQATFNMQDFLENAHPSRKCSQHKVTATGSGGLIRVHNQQLAAAMILTKSFNNMSFLWTLTHQLQYITLFLQNINSYIVSFHLTFIAEAWGICYKEQALMKPKASDSFFIFFLGWRFTFLDIVAVLSTRWLQNDVVIRYTFIWFNAEKY